jgi:GNAT superfamily N-acetyltransferase
VIVDATLRRAGPGDARAIADVWLTSFTAALPTVHRAHPDDHVRQWVAAVVVPELETWVAVAGDAIVGFLSLGDADGAGWIEQLYLAPDMRGRGIGDALVGLAKDRRPGGLRLWTFQVNRPAVRFYLRHGFVEVERTEGAANEEREPDILLSWTAG